jgi:predicted metal-dependent peptidase
MDEALYNVELHAVQMRELSMVDHELNELYQEIMDILGEKWANMTLTTAKKIIQ